MSDIALPVEQTRAEGLLGASEAAAALGLDKYTSPLTVWRRLRGLEVDEDKPEAVKEAAEWGQALEPVVRGKYALRERVGVFVPTSSATLDGWLRATSDGLVVQSHPDLEHFEDVIGVTHEWGPPSASVAWMDRIILRARQVGALGMYQGKTASAWLRDEWEGGIPAKHEIQIRVEMAVYSVPWSHVCCLLGGQRFIGPIRIERDLALEDRILTDLRAFSQLVKEGREPSPDHTAAWRAHVSEKMRKTAVELQADEETAELFKYWLDQKRKSERAKDEAAAALNDLLLRCSAAGATRIVMPDGTKIPAYQTGAKPRWKEYAISLGGADKVPEQFKGKGGTWTLRAPGGDDE